MGNGGRSTRNYFGTIAKWIIYDRGDIRGRRLSARALAARSLASANILARTITRDDVISRLIHEPYNAPRENAETARNRRAHRKHPSKGPARQLNYGGEIRYEGSSRRFRDRYTRLRLRTNRSSFSSSLLSNTREITRLRNCIETAFKARKNLLHNPLLKSSYFVVIRGNRSYTCKCYKQKIFLI